MSSDNADMADAIVTISDGDQTEFESGRAVEVETYTGYWMYTAHNIIPARTVAVINVKVSDRPGNTVEAAEEKAL